MKADFEKKNLTKKSENIAAWYNDLVLLADLADYAETRGCMIIKPWGYAIWESVQDILDKQFKSDGIKNVYFPALIPKSLFKKEKEHIEGFAPELLSIDSIGKEKLKDPYVLRPTSEAVIDKSLAKWIKSYRDLPFKINQWCNVFRAEKRTYPFLRTTEFLWQEAHTSFASEKECQEMTLKASKWYQDFYEQYFAIAPYVGLKSQSEKFAGAKNTYTIEMVAPNGKALQLGTSHNLSNNFSKVFDIQFLDKNGKKQYVYQNSFGLSTRAIGGLVLTHGDDWGLILPPKIAPLQVIILPIVKNEALDNEIINFSKVIFDKLVSCNIRADIDLDFKHTLGYRINDWELKGVPLRIEIGQKELKEKQLLTVRRDNFEKNKLNINNFQQNISKILSEIQNDLFERSKSQRNNLSTNADSYEEFKKAIAEGKFVRAFWCENEKCESLIKEETKATNRCLEFEEIEKTANGKCVYCGKKANRRWLFAKSY